MGTVSLYWAWTVDLLRVWLPPTPGQCTSICLLSFETCQFLLRLQKHYFVWFSLLLWHVQETATVSSEYFAKYYLWMS